MDWTSWAAYAGGVAAMATVLGIVIRHIASTSAEVERTRGRLDRLEQDAERLSGRLDDHSQVLNQVAGIQATLISLVDWMKRLDDKLDRWLRDSDRRIGPAE